MGVIDGSLILAMIAFGSIIFIHELGHFLFAKKVGIRVEKFFLGFDFWGLKFISFRYKGTEYGIGVFPLGGYVKMAGQEDFGEANVNGKPDEFPSKTVWQRIQVLSGGVLFNFLSAFIFCVLALWAGYRLTSNEVGSVTHGMPAWEVGIQPGDKIISYDGMATPSFDTLRTEVVLGGVKDSVKIKLMRDGKLIEKDIQPRLADMNFASIGIQAQLSLVISSVQIDSGAHKAGLTRGDKIVAINGETLEHWSDIKPIVQKHAKTSKELKVDYERKGELKQASIVLTEVQYGLFGVTPRQKTEIKSMVQGSLAEESGFSKEQVVLSIEGLSYIDFIKDEKLTQKQPLNVKVSEGGKEKQISFSGNISTLNDQISFGYVGQNFIVEEVEPGTTADKMGMKPGDKVISFFIDGEKKEIKDPYWRQFERFIEVNPGKTITVNVMRNKSTSVLKGVIGKQDKTEFRLGILPSQTTIEDTSMGTVLMWPIHMLRISYLSLWKLITGTIPVDQISGPLGIFDVTWTVAEYGVDYLLYLMAFISIHIAFFNILPLPVLDGGHLMFCIIEAIKGKPLKAEIMMKLQYAGLVFLLFILVFATYNDIQKTFF